MPDTKVNNLTDLELDNNSTTFSSNNSNTFFLSKLCLLKLPKENDNLTSTPKMTKSIILSVCTLASICSPFQTSIIFPAMSEITKHYNTTLSKVNTSVGVYLLALGIFPMYHSFLSDRFGKRPIYIFAFAGFSLMCLLACIACPTIGAFTGIRFLCGGFGSCVQTLGIGSVAGLYDEEERGFVIGIFYIGSLIAPLAAPIIGAVLCDFLGWKSTQWFMLGMSLVVLVCIILFLPETNSYQNKKNEQNTQKVFNIYIFSYILNPWRIVILLYYPPFLIVCLCASVTSAIVYYSNMILENSLASSPYNFKPLYIGLCYFPISAGYILAAIIGGKYIDKKVKKYKEQNNGALSPQVRLSYNILVATILTPVGISIQGWCFKYNVIWPVPLIGTFLLGISAMLIMGSKATYLTDELNGSSKGVALNNLCRQVCSAIACFTANRASTSLGVGYFTVLLSAVSLISCILIIIIKRKKDYFNDKKEYDLIELSKQL